MDLRGALVAAAVLGFAVPAFCADEGIVILVSRDNAARGVVDDVVAVVSRPPSKNELISDAPRVSPAVVVLAKNRWRGVDAGKTVDFGRVPMGSHIGSMGAGPCIGLIVLRAGGPTTVGHYAATEDPAETLEKVPIGTQDKVYLFGGDDSEPSNRALASVQKALKKKGVRAAGYAEFDALWTDGDGNLFVHSGAKPSSRAR